MSLRFKAKARPGSAKRRASWRNTLISMGCVIVAISWRGAQAQSDEGTGAQQLEREASTRIRVGSMVGVATMVSKDQVGRMGYDLFDALADLEFGYRVGSWVEVGLGIEAGMFPISNKPEDSAAAQANSEWETLPNTPTSTGFGGLFAALGILRISPSWQYVQPYVHVDLGPGFTGALTRVFSRIGLGLDVRVTESFWLGPRLGYSLLFQTHAPGASTDARFLWLGASFSFRPMRRVPARKSLQYATVTRIVEVREPPPPPPEKELPPELLELIERAAPGARTELLAPVLFRFDSDTLEPIGVAMLHEVARELIRRKDLEVIEIQGYADRRGSADHNLSLSERRARRVLQWLVDHGIAEERLTVAAKGASDFAEDGRSETADEQNRRVVFRVLRTAK
jgi:outer membrane protein OmpA-like peptidoglycan-associated protein